MICMRIMTGSTKSGSGEASAVISFFEALVGAYNWVCRVRSLCNFARGQSQSIKLKKTSCKVNGHCIIADASQSRHKASTQH